ncbi:MAG: hypothetical protein ACRD7E_30990 [Bryobacteraceae bacterium]
MTRRRRVVLCAIAAVFLAGCSEAPKESAKTKEPEKPPEPVTGRYAFYQMYGAARLWAPDLQGLRLTSIHLENVESEPGMAGAWEAVFVSPSRQRARRYTYSVIEAYGNLHKGVFAGLEENYVKRQAAPWNIQALKTDSTDAYKAALKKSAEYAKKNPKSRISFILEQTSRHPYLTWRVIWGASVGTSDYSVYVNASTGDYIETMR